VGGTVSLSAEEGRPPAPTPLATGLTMPTCRGRAYRHDIIQTDIRQAVIVPRKNEKNISCSDLQTTLSV